MPNGPVLPLSEPSLAAMRYQSPLRYPGAKAGLGRVVAQVIASATQVFGTPQLFVEPFAGGASTALRLAGIGAAERVLLADADPMVARFWQVAASETSWLIDRMYEEPVTLERWDYWRSWMPTSPMDRDLAVKCLFLNRTTFSGILHGRAGPIGGRSQNGAYDLGCRFNKPALEKRLRYVGDLYRANRIADVWWKDWEATLLDIGQHFSRLDEERVVAYLDPPYFQKSEKLYGRSFDPSGGYAAKSSAALAGWAESGWQHYRLAKYLRCRTKYRWILSYDNEPTLFSDPALYASDLTARNAETGIGECDEWPITKRTVQLRYSVSTKSRGGANLEMLISTLPPSCLPSYSGELLDRDDQLRCLMGDSSLGAG